MFIEQSLMGGSLPLYIMWIKKDWKDKEETHCPFPKGQVPFQDMVAKSSSEKVWKY